MDIDAVYTWVNHVDTKWKKLFENALSKHKDKLDTPECSRDIARYTNRNELYYSLKSIRLFAPWVRKIYVVTNCALPDWAREENKIQAISHEEIFLEPSFLPTFNSHAIEANLHRINGLSEHFLYFNDDVFLARPVEKKLFFSHEGKNHVFKSKHDFPYDKKLGFRSIDYSLLNTANILKHDFAYVPDKKLHHAPFPLRKSTLIEIEERYGDVLRETARHKFRDTDDIPLATTFHAYYSLLMKYGESKDIQSRYVDISDPLFLFLIAPFSPLWRSKYDTFCLNEVTGVRRFKKLRDAIVALFLNKYFS